jgi:hypothetical protein
MPGGQRFSDSERPTQPAEMMSSSAMLDGSERVSFIAMRRTSGKYVSALA